MHEMNCSGGGGGRVCYAHFAAWRVIRILLFLTMQRHANGIFSAIISRAARAPAIINRIVLYCFPSITRPNAAV